MYLVLLLQRSKIQNTLQNENNERILYLYDPIHVNGQVEAVLYIEGDIEQVFIKLKLLMVF